MNKLKNRPQTIAIIMVTALIALGGGTGGYMIDQMKQQAVPSGDLTESTVILYTNNTDDESGEQGLACIDLAGKLKTYYESQADTVLLLDIGNMFYNKAAAKLEKASPSSSQKLEGLPAGISQVIRKMNHSRYDVVFPGKRDIRNDVGVYQLREWLNESPTQPDFPILLSNILDKNSGKTMLDEAAIISEDNQLFGFIGVLDCGLIERGVKVEESMVSITRNLEDFENFDYLIMASNLDNGSHVWDQVSLNSQLPVIILDGNSTVPSVSASSDYSEGMVYVAGMGPVPEGVGYVIIDESGQKIAGVITRELYNQGMLPGA